MSNELDILKNVKKLFVDIKELIYNNPEYKYTLNQQLVKSIVSVGSNLVEGQRRGNKEFLRFLDIAIGSAAEVKFQLELYAIDNDISYLLDLSDKIIGQLINFKKYRSTL